MRIEGLSPGTTPNSGTLVLVSPSIIWGVNDSRRPLVPALAELQKSGVIEAGPINARALNTKVLAFAWRRPKSAEDAAAQRAALEATGKLFAEVHAFDLPGLTPTVVEDGPTTYLDGGELVVEVAKKHPLRIREVLPFIREPQRPDWIFEDLFAAAGAHNDPDKRLAIFDALLSFPVPAGSNRHRPTYLAALNNMLVIANKLKDLKRARALAERARPFLKENPYLTHSSASAFAASGDLDLALEMVGFATKYRYEKLDSLKTDPSLAKLHAHPGWATLFGGASKKAAAKPKAAAKKNAAAPKKKALKKKAVKRR